MYSQQNDKPLAQAQERDGYVSESRCAFLLRTGVVGIALLGMTVAFSYATYFGSKPASKKPAAVDQPYTLQSRSLEQKTKQQPPDGIAEKVSDVGARAETEHFTTPIPR